MSNICAGIGRGQLKVLNKRIEKKNEIYKTYKEAFKDITDIKMDPYIDNSKPNHWLSVISIDKNASVTPLKIMENLEEQGIETRPVWKPMHMQPVFSKYDYITVEENSVSQELYEHGVCLPSDTKMTKEEQERVINSIKEVFKEN